MENSRLCMVISIRFLSHKSLRCTSSSSMHTNARRAHKVKIQPAPANLACEAVEKQVSTCSRFPLFTYFIWVVLAVRLLPQLPVDVQPAVKRRGCSHTQGDEQQAPQRRACKRTQSAGCHLTFDETLVGARGRKTISREIKPPARHDSRFSVHTNPQAEHQLHRHATRRNFNRRVHFLKNDGV